ncbi:ATP-binding protein [Streptomyces tricolor]
MTMQRLPFPDPDERAHLFASSYADMHDLVEDLVVPAGAPAAAATVLTTAAELAAKCHKAALEGRWSSIMRFFAGPRLLVIDELGYLPLPGDGASALFQVINQRYLKSSTILTTNVGIADGERKARFQSSARASAKNGGSLTRRPPLDAHRCPR